MLETLEHGMARSQGGPISLSLSSPRRNAAAAARHVHAHCMAHHGLSNAASSSISPQSSPSSPFGQRRPILSPASSRLHGASMQSPLSRAGAREALPYHPPQPAQKSSPKRDGDGSEPRLGEVISEFDVPGRTARGRPNPWNDVSGV